MKHLKMLGLAAVAAVALMASVGAGSASAAVLCKTKTDPCNSLLKNGEALSSQMVAKTKALINITWDVVECKKSAIGGKLTKEGGKGAVPEVNVETLSFTECNCEVLVLKKGTFYVSHIVPSDNGTPFGTGQELITQCNTIFGEVKCTWLTNNTSMGELKGGNPAILSAVNEDLLLNKNAANTKNCEEEAFWTGEYEFTKPNPLYVETE